jgi:hypothetical protein
MAKPDLRSALASAPLRLCVKPASLFLTQPPEIVIFITVPNNVGTLPSAIITYNKLLFSEGLSPSNAENQLAGHRTCDCNRCR